MGFFSDAVVLVGLVVNIFILVLVFLMYTSLISIKMQTNQMHVGMATMVSKLLMIESVLSKLGIGFTEFVNTTSDMLDRLDFIENGPSAKVFKTPDGKFVAGSIEELMNKIKNSDIKGEYFLEDEIDKLRNLFEENDDDDDDDEDTKHPDQEYK
jgi:hypothetical protein